MHMGILNVPHQIVWGSNQLVGLDHLCKEQAWKEIFFSFCLFNLNIHFNLIFIKKIMKKVIHFSLYAAVPFIMLSVVVIIIIIKQCPCMFDFQYIEILRYTREKTLCELIFKTEKILTYGSNWTIK